MKKILIAFCSLFLLFTSCKVVMDQTPSSPKTMNLRFYVNDEEYSYEINQNSSFKIEDLTFLNPEFVEGIYYDSNYKVLYSNDILSNPMDFYVKYNDPDAEELVKINLITNDNTYTALVPRYEYLFTSYFKYAPNDFFDICEKVYGLYYDKEYKIRCKWYDIVSRETNIYAILLDDEEIDENLEIIKRCWYDEFFQPNFPEGYECTPYDEAIEDFLLVSCYDGIYTFYAIGEFNFVLKLQNYLYKSGICDPVFKNDFGFKSTEEIVRMRTYQIQMRMRIYYNENIYNLEEACIQGIFDYDDVIYRGLVYDYKIDNIVRDVLRIEEL